MPDMERSADELGQIIRDRRERLGRTQIQVVDTAKAAGYEMAEPTYRKIETATGTNNPTGRILSAVSVGLDWPPDALKRIRAGAAPESVDRPIELAASGLDLDELRRVDPTTYAYIEDIARKALDRANERGAK